MEEILNGNFDDLEDRASDTSGARGADRAAASLLIEHKVFEEREGNISRDPFMRKHRRIWPAFHPDQRDNTKERFPQWAKLGADTKDALNLAIERIRSFFDAQ